MPLLPILAIIMMKLCGTGHQDEYPYVDYNNREPVEVYQETYIRVDNDELEKYFNSIDRNHEAEQMQPTLKSISYRGSRLKELDSILTRHGI